MGITDDGVGYVNGYSGEEYIPYRGFFIAAPLSLNPLSYGTSWPLQDIENGINYELDSQTCVKIIKIFSENYPDIYQGFVNISNGAPGPGSKKDDVIHFQGKLIKKHNIR